jgi:putative membrane protein
MSEETGRENPSRTKNRRVHMANERTFLAWIRTSIGIMAFGFVVEKFALFVKQMTWFLMQNTPGEAIPPHFQSGSGLSSALGVLLIGLGAVMALLAFIRYKKVEKQIEEDTYQPSFILDILIAFSVVAIGIFMMIYLVHTF